MASLGYQSLPPTNLGRVDEEMASVGGRLSETNNRYEFQQTLAEVTEAMHHSSLLTSRRVYRGTEHILLGISWTEVELFSAKSST
ncbi:hypothetical protein TNCV_2201921 [Trichonephila clavipes]|uniref:Uncharacterized protein n=1 Tax=Trichonephila clavipes TaxID=2585209 RepID=A0A8X6R8A0_TRICX|nr:hypothetical protein TNCV_2201921 [Trichonephila clavipes]